MNNCGDTTPMGSQHLIIADDHPLFRAALRSAVEKVLPAAAVEECDSFSSLDRCMRLRSDADLVLLDLNMPGARGFSSLIHLRAEYPSVPVAIISAQEDPAVIRRARNFGAASFIPKSSTLETIGVAIRAVLDGDEWWPATMGDERLAERQIAANLASLTPQQLRVLMMISDGVANKVISADLHITEGTVKAHVTAILRKLNLRRRTQLIILAQKLFSGLAESFDLDDHSGGLDESED